MKIKHAIVLVALGLAIFGSRITAQDSSESAVDSQGFELWIYQVCCVAPQLNYKIEDCGEDTFRELFWNEYFLEGETPIGAVLQQQEYDHTHHEMLP